MTKIEIWLPGQPERVTHQSGTRNTRYGRTYKTDALKRWEQRLEQGLKGYVPEKPIDGPIRMSATFGYRASRKKDIGKWKVTRPDTDNMVKTIKDVMTRLGFWTDDAQVTFETCKKMWVSDPGIEIIVASLEEKEDPSW